MKTFILSVSLIGAAMLPTALAESELYVNGGVSSFDGEGVKPLAATIRGGWTWSEHFGVELEAATSLGSESWAGTDIDISIDAHYAGYLVGRYPVADNASLFGRIGYSRTEIDFEERGRSRILLGDGLAIGAGGEYMFTDQVGLRGEYSRLELHHSQGDGGTDVLSLSAVYKFGGAKK